VTELKLRNGIPVLLVERHSLPLVTLRVVLRGGARLDPRNEAGLSHVLADLVDEAAGDKPGTDILGSLDNMGATIKTRSAFDASSVSLDVDRRHLDAALDILANIVLRPSLQEADFLRVRDRAIADVVADRQRGSAVAWRILRASVYGGAPWPEPLEEGSEESLRRLSLEDVREAYRAFWTPQLASIIVVGDMTAEEARTQLESRFGNWPGKAGAIPPQEPLPVFKEGITLVDSKDASQASILVALPGPSRTATDWAALKVLNRAFGGGYASRLNLNLREAKGLTYNVRSRVTARGTASLILISGDFELAGAVASVSEILKEMQRLSTDPVAGEELLRAKNGALADLAWYLQSTSDVGMLIEDIATYALSPTTLDDYVSAVSSMTSTQLTEAASKYFVTDKAMIVIVGPSSKLEPQLSNAGLRYTTTSR
jgi:zinc protease